MVVVDAVVQSCSLSNRRQHPHPNPLPGGEGDSPNYPAPTLGLAECAKIGWRDRIGTLESPVKIGKITKPRREGKRGNALCGKLRIGQRFVATIHLFKTRPDIVVPLLQRYVKIEDHQAAAALHAFHVPLFQKIPRPAFPGMPMLREFLVQKYPAAASLQEADIADASFIDERAGNGFIDRLYASAGR